MHSDHCASWVTRLCSDQHEQHHCPLRQKNHVLDLLCGTFFQLIRNFSTAASLWGLIGTLKRWNVAWYEQLERRPPFLGGHQSCFLWVTDARAVAPSKCFYILKRRITIFRTGVLCWWGNEGLWDTLLALHFLLQCSSFTMAEVCVLKYLNADPCTFRNDPERPQNIHFQPKKIHYKWSQKISHLKEKVSPNWSIFIENLQEFNCLLPWYLGKESRLAARYRQRRCNCCRAAFL